MQYKQHFVAELGQSCSSASSRPTISDEGYLVDTSESQAKHFEVTDFNKPIDDAEFRARVLFLTAGVGILGSRILKEYIDHCDAAATASGTPTETQINMDDYSKTVKELLTISIWLTLFEQAAVGGRTLPAWFKDFILACHNVADKVQPKPTAREVDERYQLDAAIPDICTQVSINLCMQLNLGSTAPDALIYLGELLLREKPARAELLEFALTQPVADLDKRIKES